jgi:hypothetical protein
MIYAPGRTYQRSVHHFTLTVFIERHPAGNYTIAIIRYCSLHAPGCENTIPHVREEVFSTGAFYYCTEQIEAKCGIVIGRTGFKTQAIILKDR